MERILILMQAANPGGSDRRRWTSARENALHRNAPAVRAGAAGSPDIPEECNMAAFGALRYLVSPEMTFAAMETLWHGERYAAGIRRCAFERDWEKKPWRALNDCPVEKRSGGADGLSAGAG